MDETTASMYYTTQVQIIAPDHVVSFLDQSSVNTRIYKSLANIAEFRPYALQTLLEATDNFHPSKFLGKGSFGEVFEGCVEGRAVAIKRLPQEARNIPLVREDFEREIRNIGAVNHRNIVQLLGFCLDGDTPLLVCPKLCSLQSALKEENLHLLGWDARYRIAVGIARGLAYLHSGARDPMVHCDIKPGNVLFDGETFEAYIADFGLAQVITTQQTAQDKEAADFRVGTLGYMAPELKKGDLSVQADVYSFGKLLYALVSGNEDVRKLPDSLVTKKGGYLRHFHFRGLERISFVFSSARIFLARTNFEVVDRHVRCTVTTSTRATLQASKALDLISLCTQENPKYRPDMERVVTQLERATSCSVPFLLTAIVKLGGLLPRLLVVVFFWILLAVLFVFNLALLVLLPFTMGIWGPIILIAMLVLGIQGGTQW